MSEPTIIPAETASSQRDVQVRCATTTALLADLPETNGDGQIKITVPAPKPQPHRFLLVEFWCESTTEDEEACRARLMSNLCATMRHLEKDYPALKWGAFNHFPPTHVPGL